jgi:glycosidase
MKKWISSAVLYQINLRSLAAREPRNAFEAAREKPESMSPLAYVTRQLPTIKKLGANVLYLMPPYPIGIEKRKGIGSPYASRNFREVEPEYGTLNEIKALIQRAHQLKFKVIFDITPNHTSRDHVWMQEHPEYYVKDANGQAFFDCDWSDTAKLDYTNPSLSQEMIEVYDFWLSLLGRSKSGEPDGIDGFRLDMAHFINDRSFWNHALPTLRKRHPTRELLFLAECYGFQNNLDLFQRSMTAAYDDDFYKICVYGYAQKEDGTSVVRLSDDAQHNQDFKDKHDAFLIGGIAGAVEKHLENCRQAFQALPEPHFLARYTDNHDEGRGMFRFGEGAVRAMNQLLFLLPNTLPFLLTGQEFGALNRPSIHDRLRPCDKGRRLTNGDKTWNQDGVEFEGNIFARGQANRKQLYEFYQTLIHLRLKTPELLHGDIQLIDVGEECAAADRTVVAFSRTYKNKTVYCAINLGTTTRILKKAELFAGATPLYGQLAEGVLPAFSAVVVRSV